MNSAFSEVTLRNLSIEELQRHAETDDGCLMELGRRAIDIDFESKDAEIEELQEKVEELEALNKMEECPECGACLSDAL
jgi:hypothetical protein